MDPTTAQLLFLGFILAIGITGWEMRGALEAPRCAQCSHCRQEIEEKRRREAEMREWYAQRWGVGERDEDDRRR